MNKFQNGKIYKIINDMNDECYIGSTCNTLSCRWHIHKQHAKSSDSRLYRMINEIGIEHFKIELFEEYPCETKEQLLQREGYFIQLFGTLNKNIAGNCSDIKEWTKKYREEHNEEIKQYRQNHKEEIKQYNQKYYENNREQHIKKMCEKALCTCGRYVQKGKLTRHQQTNLHKKLLQNIQVVEPVLNITEPEYFI